MPRVSEEHLERRRQQILDAAEVCFAHKGFHATSMQDVFAESGLSAGAVYRYFKSKDELVMALATDAMHLLGGVLDEAIHRDPLPTPAELVATLTTEIARLSERTGRVRLAPQAWALGVTNDNVKPFVSTAIGTIRARWAEYAERMRAAGWLPPDADTEAVAKALIGILPGFMLQHLLLGDTTPDDLARGLNVILPDYRRIAESHE
ncbi:TetR/AcrR family transcriptional regulator [Nocardia sp. BMG51109]|uniref:TetR/AcrR family transcriptional regulator n=1 Tax=Nocardia sp. BMG51109 TaxID=1056816 RepID=UPI000466BE17|nr:TetR/AcrR family transcriptional regulator [Nocardia sp. BMG51109]